VFRPDLALILMIVYQSPYLSTYRIYGYALLGAAFIYIPTFRALLPQFVLRSHVKIMSVIVCKFSDHYNWFTQSDRRVVIR